MDNYIEIRRFKGALEPDDLKAACDAYENAVALVKSSGAPLDCELIADRIVTFARTGIRDPQRLCRLALTGLVIRKDHRPEKHGDAR